MSRDKNKNHQKILDSALEEFMEFGFEKASLRRIARKCDISVSALYKHFDNKEELFATLVSPAVDGFIDAYKNTMEDGFKNIKRDDIVKLMLNSNESEWVINYIYEHYEAFKLLICKSKGTRFENYLNQLIEFEEQMMQGFMEWLKAQDITLNKLSQKEFYTLTMICLESVFKVVEVDFSYEEAIEYARNLDRFFAAGWKGLLLDN